MRSRSRGYSALTTKILLVIAITVASDELPRHGRLLPPLFSLVTFKNVPCQSNERDNSLASRGFRSGTCFERSQCVDYGGNIRGGCAAGFGVCCVFDVSESGSTIRQNCSYITNPGRPGQYSGSESITYTVNKCSEDVCFLRMDFQTFSIQGTGNTQDGNQCQDQFRVQVSSGQNIPIICGENSGQHIFVDLGPDATNSATLSFDFNGEQDRSWDIKVTQYACQSENAPPNGCLQYHTELTGRISTFNYDAANDNHLPNQRYSICVRQENGYCCVRYSVCQDEADNSFSLSTRATSEQDSNCATEDFIAIPGSSSQCRQNPGGQLSNKYCGRVFSDIIGGSMSIFICDCTPPFSVDVFTNDAADSDPTVQSKGVCLDYTQIPCTG